MTELEQAKQTIEELKERLRKKETIPDFFTIKSTTYDGSYEIEVIGFAEIGKRYTELKREYSVLKAEFEAFVSLQKAEEPNPMPEGGGSIRG